MTSCVFSGGTTAGLASYDVPNLATRTLRIVGRGSSSDDDLALSEVRIKGY